jgi:hypothetical protein
VKPVRGESEQTSSGSPSTFFGCSSVTRGTRHGYGPLGTRRGRLDSPLSRLQLVLVNVYTLPTRLAFT